MAGGGGVSRSMHQNFLIFDWLSINFITMLFYAFLIE